MVFLVQPSQDLIKVLIHCILENYLSDLGKRHGGVLEREGKDIQLEQKHKKHVKAFIYIPLHVFPISPILLTWGTESNEKEKADQIS